ncbi:iron ABC transporter ATP-binding protein [Cellulosilyticum sp. I15G10I2]|uniref:iron ABC transporter ATP-binding protein n=1 Tax=Cellulosilyticum sp. I15G10I2 TaxID=1892843 RepID=UPI002FE61DDF
MDVKSLTKKYQDKTIVDQVSFEIPKGKITALIGANGAGKSTVLSLISRLISGDGGEVSINGTSLGQWKREDLAKVLSILMQSTQMEMKITVEELVAFGRFPYSKGRLTEEDEEEIRKALEYMELMPFKDRYLDQLSGGERQRAFIAMVIVQNTEYILLDEPLNNLDMKHSVEIMKIIRRLTKDLNKTIVLVIHDINFAARYADYIIAMKNGRLFKMGKTEEIIQQDVLENIYDLPFEIRHFEGKPLCIYYQ